MKKQALNRVVVARSDDRAGEDQPRVEPVRTVLIVDEEGSARRELERSFRALGIETFTVADLREAQVRAAARAPDLLVLEIGPVPAAGLAVVEVLRERLPGTRIVVATSYGSVASAVRSMRCGAAHYLCKPVTASLILEALGSAHPLAHLAAADGTGVMTLDQAIWEYLHQTVEMAGSLAEAARRLGLWRQSLRRMLNKYRPPERAAAGESASLR